MDRRIAVWVWPLLLVAASPTAVAAPDATIEDGEGETLLDALDIRRVEVVTDPQTVEVRLVLKASPGETMRPESLATAAWEYHYLYHVLFETRPAGEPEGPAHVVDLSARAAFVVHPALPCPCWAGVDWRFLLDVRPGGLDSEEETTATSYPVEADGDRTIVWRLDRAALAARAGILDPGKDWLLANLHATSMLRGYVADGTSDWAARQRPGAIVGEDRAPDQGYPPPLHAPGDPSVGVSRGAAPVDPDRPVTAAEADPSGWRASAPAAPASVLAGSVGLLAVICFALRPRLGYPAWAALFSRLGDDEALSHPRRAALLALLRTGPATFALLRQTLEIGSGPLAHHLAVLERHGLIASVRDHGRRVYELHGQTPQAPAPLPSHVRILRAVESAPGQGAADVARAAGLARTSALYHLRKLQRTGIVRSVRTGGVRRFFPA